jgi:hypothetical protein
MKSLQRRSRGHGRKKLCRTGADARPFVAFVLSLCGLLLSTLGILALLLSPIQWMWMSLTASRMVTWATAAGAIGLATAALAAVLGASSRARKSSSSLATVSVVIGLTAICALTAAWIISL